MREIQAGLMAADRRGGTVKKPLSSRSAAAESCRSRRDEQRVGGWRWLGRVLVTICAALAGSGAIGWLGTEDRDGFGRLAAGRVSAAETGAATKTGYRRLAPGALTVIPPRASNEAHAIRRDLLEVTEGLRERKWTPKHAPVTETLVELAKNREFQRNIWCLEFAFKPPRMIDVDVPLSGQRMQRKRVWYLVYRVRNTGGRRTVIDQDDATKRTVEKFTEPVRFVPHLVLESLEGLSEAEGETAYRSYLDRIVPSAVDAIRKREDPAREILDSASMAAADIPPGAERWGVAVWEDVDPRIDYFSISIRGLTNAVQWRPRPNATFAADRPPGSELEHALESLRLDFWRPGDDRDDADEEMSVGFAGMFERRTLGGRLLEAIERPGLVKSRPASGLDELGLSWADLVAEPDDQAGPSAAADLVPLAKVLVAVGKVPQPSARGPLVKAVLGDLAADWIEQLSKGLFGPAEGPREAARRKAMEEAGLKPETAARQPLESLAKVLESLAKLPDPGTRRRRSQALFGEAAPRVEGLLKELSLARTVAALEDVAVNPRVLKSGGALAAFDAIVTALGSQADPEERRRLLGGLFGPRGPLLYEKATEVPEGIDHTWVFKYETEAG